MQKSVKLGLFVLCVALACLCGCKGLQAAHGHATPEAAGMSGQDQNRPLVLTNCRIIDGTGRSPLTDGVLVVADGRIAAVGKIPKEAFPADCRIIDLQGATVLPGLVNAHVHNAYREAHAALWASCGVTTVRDLSCGRSEVDKAVAFRDRARANPRLCRVVSAGSMITVPWGYMGLYGITVRSERDARAKVQKQLDAGVDCLKITLQEPAFTHPANLSPALAGFITALAHERGVPVTAHVGTTKDLRVALDCGVDDIAHVTSDELTDELIDRMVKAGVYLEPTLTNWATDKGRQREIILANVRRFIAAGGLVALGAEHIHTAKNAGPFIGMPIAEFLMMREAGMTPMQIITASTQHAARVCRLDGILGTLETGKIADILVLNGDPLADLNSFAKVRMVIRDGVIIRE